MNDIVVADRLAKSYGNTRALEDASFSVGSGECVVILGPNGAGKTTLMEILEGIIAPSSGRVLLFGLSPSDMECRRKIGVQTETGAFEAELRVAEILSLYGSFYTTGMDQGLLLESLGLSAKKKSFFSQLSKGMKQKVAVAVALVNDPQVIFLDEPSSGLDIESRRDIWEFIQSLKKRGKTILLTTHDIQEAGALADRIIILSAGRIKKEGEISALFDGFPSRMKVEYIGAPVAAAGIAASMSIANRQVVFTDAPEPVAAAARDSGGHDVQVTKVNLEDIYLYYQSGNE